MGVVMKRIKQDDIKYLILVTTIIDNRYHAYDKKRIYMGFSNERHQVISNFLTGQEIQKTRSLNGLVQLPKLFDSNKDALLHIREHKKIDAGLRISQEYIIVPVKI